MKTILYITAYQYSGTTLASFLLNIHPKIATVGHTMGWPFKDKHEFLCSCGEPLNDCKFWKAVENKFAEEHEHFSFDNFNTRFKLVTNEWINRKLLESVRFGNYTTIENIRDRIVSFIPMFTRKLNRQLTANRLLMTAALDYYDANAFVDNSHNPYRLKRLKSLEGFKIMNLHLLRDPRGIALSNIRTKNLDVQQTIKLWLRYQENIVRIINEQEISSLLIYYEDLCKDPNKYINKIHKFLGLDYCTFTGNFKETEHHILGNTTRFGTGVINQEEKWRVELSSTKQRQVMNMISQYVKKNKRNKLSKILEYYITR